MRAGGVVRVCKAGGGWVGNAVTTGRVGTCGCGQVARWKVWWGMRGGSVWW